jgi:hypothetical protein
VPFEHASHLREGGRGRLAQQLGVADLWTGDVREQHRDRLPTLDRRGRNRAHWVFRSGQGIVLAEDRLLELPQRRARLDPELVDEHPPRGLVGLERLGLPAGAVEREHQLAAETLPERVLGDERLELAHKLGARTLGEPSVDQVFERGGVQLVEATGFVGGERLEREVRERRAAPERERPAQLLNPLFPGGGLALGRQPLEAAEVDLLWREVEEIAAGLREHESRSEGAAELSDVVLERRPRRPWRVLAPEAVDERVAGDRLAWPQ